MSTLKVQNIQHTNGTTAATIDGSGRLITAARPSFLAHRLASGSQGLSGNTETLVQLNETDHNVGSHYNTSTYTFTCPVTGLYQFNHWVYVYSPQQTNSRLYINGVSVYRFSSIETDTGNNPHGAGGGVSLLLNANDTVQLYIWASEAATVYAGDASRDERSTFFSGYLVG